MGTQRKISREEYSKLQEACEQANARPEFADPTPDMDGATLAMMGAGYRIGDITVPQISLDTVAMMAIAGVSVLDGSSIDDDADNLRDIAVALYIIANGAEACHMLMGVKQRQKALSRLEGLAAKSPDMFSRYLDKIDAIGGGAFAELDSRAIAFLGQIKGATLPDIAEVIAQMAEDFAVVMGMLPQSNDDGGSKKN